MRKLLILLFLLSTFTTPCVFANEQQPLKPQISTKDIVVFSNKKKNLFGLKDKSGNVIVEPQYKKLIRLGNSSWIINKKNKYGLIDCSGNIIVEPKYRHVDRKSLRSL